MPRFIYITNQLLVSCKESITMTLKLTRELSELTDLDRVFFSVASIFVKVRVAFVWLVELLA